MKRDPSKIRIKKVSGYKDARTTCHISSRGVISVTPKTTKGEIAHEEGHYVLGHNLKGNPKTPSVYARQEIDASVYAYNKVGQPKRMKPKIRAIYNDLTHYEYKESPKKAKSEMDKIMNRREVPTSFKKDWDGIKREIKKAFDV